MHTTSNLLNLDPIATLLEDSKDATKKTVETIDLVLIDQQSVGKRSLHLMDTVNAKKRWTPIYWRVNKLLKESHIVTNQSLG
jgi:hypothetical protein